MTLHRSFPSPTRLALFLSLALTAASCGQAESGASKATAKPASTAAPAKRAAVPAPTPVAASIEPENSQAALVDEIAAGLQACAYDGTPVRVNKFGSSLPTDCRDMVAQIMNFTGLPQNFKVVEADVPNAAAVIMLDEHKIPQRVIAFNTDFMNIVRRATHGNDWAPISVMAHEIGHHLSGHTITPGGSQPPTELEADKFSGFVLYKMGASLADAQVAMSELVADGPDGKTHPGRGKRLRAIKDGWTQACEQQGSPACEGGTQTAQAPSAPQTQTAPAAQRVPATQVAQQAPAAPVAEPVASAPQEPATPIASSTPAAQASTPATQPAPRAVVDHVPAPGGTPSKFDHFIYDEYGVLDQTWREKFEKDMFEHAQKHGVEIVTLLVKDTRGLSGDDYAWAMLRQLRVGKLDVGNGAVLVVAPEQGQVGLAMGPGIALQMEGHDKKAQLQRWLDSAWTQCQRKQACGNWSENFMLAADHIRRDTDDFEWTVRYASFDALMDAYLAYNDARRESGASFDPDADPSYAKITQIDATIVKVDVQPGYSEAFVNEVSARNKVAIHARTSKGHTLVLYAAKGMDSLMPAGALAEGQNYRLTARVQSLSWNPKDTQSLNLLSYDKLN